jgi:hypothetical protein
MDQVVERLPSKREAQSLNPSTQKKKKVMRRSYLLDAGVEAKKGSSPSLPAYRINSFTKELRMPDVVTNTCNTSQHLGGRRIKSSRPP